jgi:glycosyltransferase involved in cell wall biosynthesis
MDRAPLELGDVLVLTEGFHKLAEQTKAAGDRIRRILLAMGWSYVYRTMPDGTDWRQLGIERALTNSPFTRDFLTWAMGLPVHVFQTGINPRLYYEDPAAKKKQVCYILRKAGAIEQLKRVLWSRRREFIEQINWFGLEGLSEQDYAREIRQSSLFISVSAAEGLPFAMLEAMRSGTQAAGYNSVGGQRELIGDGSTQNCILADTMDYVTLAQRLEPLLSDIMTGDLTRWGDIRLNAIKASQAYTLEAEEESVVSMWKEILATHASH